MVLQGVEGWGGKIWSKHKTRPEVYGSDFSISLSDKVKKFIYNPAYLLRLDSRDCFVLSNVALRQGSMYRPSLELNLGIIN